ncbi:MAG: hypothetical protein ACI8ZB_000765 [Desulforhopalus sp.]|jgi:hypothetical protein
MRILSTRYRPFLFLTIVVLTLSTSSCTALIESFKTPPPQEQEITTQAGADTLFINGDFENALLEFEQIYETALSHEDRNAALYGLACTQMMLANSDLQLIEAIDNLLRWDANKGSAPFTENRHLLTLALRQQSYLIQQKHVALDARENRKNNVIAYQKKKISQMSTTLHNLQNQLKELEEIDETYQEKRKPL